MRRCIAPIAGALLAISAITPSLAQAESRPCQPPTSSQRGDDVVASATRSSGDRVETTRYLRGLPGLYETSVCTSDGDFVKATAVARLPYGKDSSIALPLRTTAPDGATLRITSYVYADLTEPQGLQYFQKGGGHDGVNVPPAVPATTGVSAWTARAKRVSQARHRVGSRPLARVADAGCTQTGWTSLFGTSVIWPLVPSTGMHSRPYRINLTSIPGGIAGAPASRIVDGHNTWNYGITPCTGSVWSSYNASYGGGTGYTAGAFNGANTADFGNLTAIGCGGAGVLACAPTWPNGSAIVEADVRFSSSAAWWAGTGSPPAGTYDVWSVAAHEAGHELGLGHAAGNYLTMYATVCGACVRMRDLGTGDLNGFFAHY